MAPHRIHVAVLDTDVPCLSVYAKRGLYSSRFKKLLQAAASRLNKDNPSLASAPLSVHTTAFDAVGETLPPLECLRTTPKTPAESTTSPQAFSPIDAILITGSVASSYDDEPWIHTLSTFIQTVYNDYPLVKIFGSCFGHQLIAQSLLSGPNNAGLGLENANSPSASASESTFYVERSKDFEVGIHPITLNPAFTAHFPNLSSDRQFRIQLIHGDIVVPTPAAIAAAAAGGRQDEVALPSPWINMGHSASCQIQGLYVPGRIITYQGHFEFDAWLNTEMCYEFARRFNWAAPVVDSYVGMIERSLLHGQRGEQHDDDDDDSKAAAEAVLLLFAGMDGGVGCSKSFDGEGFGSVGGMLTPPMEQS